MDNKNALAALIAQTKPVFVENPYWTSDNTGVWDKIRDKPFDLEDVKVVLPYIVPYFRMNYDSFKSESQVLVLTDDEYQKVKHWCIPEIDQPSSLHVLVLPQENTWGNTSVSETFWQNEIVSKGVNVLMRIHTHHVLHAYQSITDWSTLNSGTLEVVVGKIYDDIPEIAYWLDVRGTNNKDNVYHTDDLGDTVKPISNGKERITK